MEPAQDHAEEGTKAKRGLREWLTRPKNKPKKTSKDSPVYGIRGKAVAGTKRHGLEGGASSNHSGSGGAETTTRAADLETTVTSLPQTTAIKPKPAPNWHWAQLQIMYRILYLLL
jgi:hypothetical protein